MIDISEYDYNLPEELIARYPVEPRDSCRLMVLNREKKTIEHKVFKDIKDYLREKDLLVLNDTKVIPARLIGKKKTGAQIEIFLLNPLDNNGYWEALVRKLKRLKEKDRVFIGEGLEVELIEKKEGGKAVVRLIGENIKEKIYTYGQIPLPPYIERKPEERDKELYQTVFARKEGAVAAPTAGLHFTEELLEEIKKRGVKIAYVTLHVGIGTFKPLSEENLREKKLHREFYSIPEETVNLIEKTREKGGRVIAVGTTVVRTLETYAINKKKEGFSELFIYPPFDFKIIDSLITNFHLPKSSLLLLVSAFAGKDFILKAYKEAVMKRYRFFSYGDAMFIQ